MGWQCSIEAVRFEVYVGCRGEVWGFGGFFFQIFLKL